MAFSSACEQRHSSSRVPLLARLLHLGHPPSLQFFVPRGVPLYPVETIRLSRTMTAPTLRLIQLLRMDATCAIFIKYSSQLGLGWILVCSMTHWLILASASASGVLLSMV